MARAQPPSWRSPPPRRPCKRRRRAARPARATNGAADHGPGRPRAGAAPCSIKVIGVGGGSNAVNRMVESSIRGVEFWVVNTDAQALAGTRRGTSGLHIGKVLTRVGRGRRKRRRAAADESRDDIEAMVAGADLVFITAGMGGGTGSGAAAVAIEAIERLEGEVDTLIVVSNDKLLSIVPANAPLADAFLVADDVLRQGIVGISEIIVKPGLINVDFADRVVKAPVDIKPPAQGAAARPGGEPPGGGDAGLPPPK
ncbi:hypothetical protein JL720_12178 [Aureococcus anophagefferens]|nr:hypothetical protein JL720_12178 [Aureococcus anophagefferens]